MRRFVAALCCLVAGCSWVPTWGVYKIDINQGNYITQDSVEKLKVGQTKSQVRVILGTPLVADAFHANRWDYVYLTGKANDVHARHKITVIFDGDKLKHVEGDIVPADMLSQVVPDTRKP